MAKSSRHAMERQEHLEINSDGSRDSAHLNLQSPHNSFLLRSDPCSFSPQSNSHSRHLLFVDVSTNLLRSGHAIRFETKGKSMHPTIRDKEAITVEPISPLRIKRKDIVLYETTTNNITVHRVIRIIENDHPLALSLGSNVSLISSLSWSRPKKAPVRFVLRGDALDMCDEAVELHQVLGKVVFVERRGHKLRLDGRSNKVVQSVSVSLHRFHKQASRILNRVFFQMSRLAIFVFPHLS